MSIAAIGLALGGQVGMRLVARLCMPVSADTILRIARRAYPTRDCAVPRILGVDDWAWRRGQRYGTILVDLETKNVVDLLPDRETDTLFGWLADHPGVEVIARDRAGAYARGAREGVPKAQQVADRWHLLRNCSDALQNVVERRYRLIRDVGKSLMVQIDTDDRTRAQSMKEDQLHRRRAARQQNNRHHDRRALFKEVIRLHGLGWSQLAIKRELGIDLKTIRKWLKDNEPGAWERSVFIENPADAHAAYVHRRWLEGCGNATQLYREVCVRGYRERVKTFRQWVKIRLRDGILAPALSRASRKSSWRTPSSRQTVRLLTAEVVTLPPKERAFVNAIFSASPEIATAADLARRFQSMICSREIAGALRRSDKRNRNERCGLWRLQLGGARTFFAKRISVAEERRAGALHRKRSHPR